MRTHHAPASFLAALSALLCACTGAIGDPRSTSAPPPPGPSGPTTPDPSASPMTSAPPTPSTPPLPAAGACQGASLGRSYVSVLGAPREADRVDLGLGFERDIPVINTHWYQFELEDRLYGIFESYPHGELFRPEGVIGTFNGVRPAHSFARINQGPLTPVKLFEISFHICLAEIASRRGYSLWDHDRYRSPPTVEGATTFCGRVLKNAERHEVGSADLESCVSYATVDVSTDPVPERQWAYVCGMIGATTMSWTR